MRYRITKFRLASEFYLVTQKTESEWRWIASYAVSEWKGRALKQAIRAKRTLIQQSKALNKEGEK